MKTLDEIGMLHLYSILHAIDKCVNHEKMHDGDKILWLMRERKIPTYTLIISVYNKLSEYEET